MSGDYILRHHGRQPLAIANGGTVSEAFEAKGWAAYGLVIPAAFTGTGLTFQVSADNQTFQVLYDTLGVVVAVVVAQGRSYDVPVQLMPWPYWKIVSGSAEGAARTLVVVAKG